MTSLLKIVNIQEQEYIAITYFPTDICNFDCSYCFPGSHPAKFRYRDDIDFVIDNFRKLFEFYKDKFNKTKIYLEIAGGGEPTLWPHLVKFCTEIRKEHDVYIQLTCNGSRTIRWWKTIIPYIDEVILSYHNEYTDIKHYMEVADLIWENGKKITAMVLMDAPNWDKCLADIETMKQSKYSWFILAKEVVIAPGHDIESCTEEQLKFLSQPAQRLPESDYILKNRNDFKMVESIAIYPDDKIVPANANYYLINKLNYFTGWKCNVVSEKITIFPSGNISGSCNIKFNVDLNLYSTDLLNDLKNIDRPYIICDRDCCACQPDTHITKWKS